MVLNHLRFNLFLVLLPEFDLRIGRYIWVFNSYTWVGYFLFCGQWAVLTFILCCFKEPPRKARRKPPPLTPCDSELVGNVATVGGSMVSFSCTKEDGDYSLLLDGDDHGHAHHQQ